MEVIREEDVVMGKDHCVVCTSTDRVLPNESEVGKPLCCFLCTKEKRFVRKVQRRK